MFFIDFATDSKHLKTIDKKWNEIIPYVLDYYNTVSKKDIKEVSQKIREAYLKDEHVTMKMYDNLVQVILVTLSHPMIFLMLRILDDIG